MDELGTGSIPVMGFSKKKLKNGDDYL